MGQNTVGGAGMVIGWIFYGWKGHGCNRKQHVKGMQSAGSSLLWIITTISAFWQWRDRQSQGFPPFPSTYNPVSSPASNTPSCPRATNKELQKPLEAYAHAPSLIPSFRFILFLVFSMYLIMHRTLHLLQENYKGLLCFSLSLTLLKNWVHNCLYKCLKNFKACIKCSLYTLLPIAVTQIVPFMRWPQSLPERRKNSIVTVKRKTVSISFLCVFF